MSQPCKAKTKDGEACGGFAQGKSDYCFTHDPKRSLARSRARQLGGYISRQPKNHTSLSGYNLRTTKGLLDFMGALMGETSKMPQSLKRDQTLSNIAKNLSRLIIQYNLEVAEKDMNQRLQEIDDKFALQEIHERISEMEKQVKDTPP